MKLTVQLLLVFLSTFLFSTTAPAVDDIGVFEMDGNAVEDWDCTAPGADCNCPTCDYEDWSTLFNGEPTQARIFTFDHDHEGVTIFEGGRKDILDIDTWRWKDGSVPDKDDITHAYAAAYLCPAGQTDCTEGDTIIYFGADRFSNTGDAFLGFWFFKNHITMENDGTFSGMHTEGDVLVLVNFPQAGNAEPEIRVVSWAPGCMKGVKNPGEGDCLAKNIMLEYDGVVCSEVAGYDLACAETNTEALFDYTGLLPGTIIAPWDYEAKSPDPGCGENDFCMPYESFFEGGFNVSELFEGEDACFASFMVETRSSSEFTATLKDFVLDEFPLCRVELSKDCGVGTYNEFTDTLDIPYTVTIENTGQALVHEVVATDDVCGYGTATHTFTDIAADTSQTLGGTCHIPRDSLLPEYVYNGVSAVADGGDIPVYLADSPGCTTREGSPGVCFDQCEFNLSPEIGLEKDCYTWLDDSGGVVQVMVDFTGRVWNDSSGATQVPLKAVSVVDDQGTPSETGDDVTLVLRDCTSVADPQTPLPTPVWLDPGEEACFEGSYPPVSVNSSTPYQAEFMDEVSATATSAYTGGSVGPEVATATCRLCPECEPCDD